MRLIGDSHRTNFIQDCTERLLDLISRRRLTTDTMNLAELKERLKTLYNPDPTGTLRRSQIKTEHYSRVSL